MKPAPSAEALFGLKTSTNCNFRQTRKVINIVCTNVGTYGKVQVGKDQEKAQSEKDSHSKNRGGKKPN